MRGIWGPGPYQSQSRQTEIGQVIAQAAAAVLMLLVAVTLAWLQACVAGLAFSLPVFAAGMLIGAWQVRRSGAGARVDVTRAVAAVVLTVTGLALSIWPPRPAIAFGEGRLWLTFPTMIARLVRVTGVAIPMSVSGIVLASVVNLTAIGISLLTALRLVVEVVFPNLLNSIRALGGRFTGLGEWWHGIRYPSDADEEDDGPESGGIPRRGTNVAG